MKTLKKIYLTFVINWKFVIAVIFGAAFNLLQITSIVVQTIGLVLGGELTMQDIREMKESTFWDWKCLFEGYLKMTRKIWKG